MKHAAKTSLFGAPTSRRARRCCFQRRPLVARKTSRPRSGSRAYLRRHAGRRPDGVVRETRAEDGVCAIRDEARGSRVERVSGRAGYRRRAFSRNARSHRASRSVARLRRHGSRETRDAPGDASDASVDVSVLSRSVTRAWRDDSGHLRASPPERASDGRVVARGARSRRGEEGLRARPVASVLWTGGAARDEARADVRRGETGERARRRAGACAAGRHARTRAKALASV